MRTKIGKNKTLIMLISITICALFIGTSISPVMASEAMTKDERKEQLREEEQNADPVVTGVDDSQTAEEQEGEIVDPNGDDDDDDAAVGTDGVDDSQTAEEETRCSEGFIFKDGECIPIPGLVDSDSSSQEEELCAECALEAKEAESEQMSGEDMELILMRDYGFSIQEISILKDGISELKVAVVDYQTLSSSEKQDLIAQYYQEYDINVFEEFDRSKAMATSIVENKDVKSIPRISARLSAEAPSTSTSDYQPCDLAEWLNSCNGVFGSVLDNLWLWVLLVAIDPVAAFILFLLLLDIECGGIDDDGSFDSLTNSLNTYSASTTVMMQTGVTSDITTQTYSAASSTASQTAAL